MLKFRKYALKDKIYGYSDMCGFGDIWALTSYLLRVSEEAKKPTRYFSRNQHMKEIIQSIIPHLRTKGKIQFAWHPAQRPLGYCEPFAVKLVPTKKHWQYNPSARIVAYQFDGNHLSHQKNLPPHRLLYLIKSLTNMGYKPIDVGHKKPLPFIIDVLSKCKFFVGCPSGLSVVSLSVGCPIILITRMLDPRFLGFMRACHYKTKQVEMFMTVDEFLIRARRVSRIGRVL